METTLERLKRILKEEFHGYKWERYTYEVYEEDEYVGICQTAPEWITNFVCRIYPTHIQLNIQGGLIPHKLTMLIAKALRAPSGMYKVPKAKE